MRLTTGIAILGLILPIPGWASEISTVDQQALATDYAMSGLSEEAKQLLIPLLHDGRDPDLDPVVRMTLASTCLFLDEDPLCTFYHWDRILQDAPESSTASEVRQMLSLFTFMSEGFAVQSYRDWLFRSEMKTVDNLWSYKAPDWLVSWEQVESAEFALAYLQHLQVKYQNDPAKIADVLYQMFLIEIGFNDNDYGLLQQFPTVRRDYTEPDKISKQLLDIPGAEPLYIHTQFLLGITRAEGKVTGKNVKLNKDSLPYFEHILEKTDGQITNPYRIFSFIWMKRFYERKGEKLPERFREAPPSPGSGG